MTYADLTGIPIARGGTAGMWNGAANTKQVIVVHDTESGTAAGALSWMRSQQNGSYHLLVDTDGDVVRMVPDSRQAWAAMTTGNRIGLHLCATGFASYRLSIRRAARRAMPRSMRTRRYDGICEHRGGRRAGGRWADYPALLDEMARQLATWSTEYGIPLVALNAAQVRAGQRGVCGHAEISGAFRESDHTDPGTALIPLILPRAQAIAAGSTNLLGMTTAELAEAATNLRQLGPT